MHQTHVSVCLSWLRIRQLSCIVFEVFSRRPQFRCVRAANINLLELFSVFFFSNRLVKYHRFVIHAYTRSAMFRLQGAWSYSKELQGTVNECICKRARQDENHKKYLACPIVHTYPLNATARLVTSTDKYDHGLSQLLHET